MTKNQLSRKNKIWNSIIFLLSVIGLIVCIALLFLQVRQMILDLVIRILNKEPYLYESWIGLLFSLASGGICFILLFDYCTLTNSGRELVKATIQGIKDCLSEIDYKIFIKPVLLMSILYLLGILTIIRANYLYVDDAKHSILGIRLYYDWSRYIAEFLSTLVHADINVTDISPLPQLLAIPILSFSSVLLVFILNKRKITIVRLLACIPLGLSPYFLEGLVLKFFAPYMALSILASIVPFLFITRKKAFLFVSVISLLVMCMTYQAASGIYMLITVALCFQYWNNREKTNKETLSFFGVATFAFCLAMLIFRFFLMKHYNEQESGYVSNSIHPISHIISGTFNNIKNFTIIINNDLSIIWKIGILLILLFFIIRSTRRSAQKKIFSFIISILFIGISFILSFGAYSLLAVPLNSPRAFIGFGVFLAVLCIYTVDYNKTATLCVFALSWFFFIFAFSFGNALADQARYAEFRIGLFLHDLSTLYPNKNKEDIIIQIKNSIDYAPSVKNIAKHSPIIKRYELRRFEYGDWSVYYCLEHFNFASINSISNRVDEMDLPVVLDSYYHTIKSDGESILVVLKH